MSNICRALNNSSNTRCAYPCKLNGLCGIHRNSKIYFLKNSNNEQPAPPTQNSNLNPNRNVQSTYDSISEPVVFKLVPLTFGKICKWTPDKHITIKVLKITLKSFGFRKKLNVPKGELLEKFKTLQHYCHHIKSVRKIQCWYKTKINAIVAYFHGPHANERTKCVNQTEMITLEDIGELPTTKFISHEENGYVYAFSVDSILQLFSHNHHALNPYTRTPLPKSLEDRANALNETVYTPYPKGTFKRLIYMSRFKTFFLESKIQKWCTKIDENYGFRINPGWIIKLSKRKLHHFFDYTERIWNHLPYRIRETIVPTKGELFPRSMKYRRRRIYYSRVQMLSLAFDLLQSLCESAHENIERERGIIIACSVLYIVCRASRPSLSWAADINFDEWVVPEPQPEPQPPHQSPLPHQPQPEPQPQLPHQPQSLPPHQPQSLPQPQPEPSLTYSSRHIQIQELEQAYRIIDS